MRLCVALDMHKTSQNMSLAKEIKKNFPNDDIWLKVGLRSYIRDNNEFIKILQDMNFKIFLDLKIYDIPNTMLDSLYECMQLGINMLTIHASCGYNAMHLLSQSLKDNNSNMLLVAVSALTSFDNQGFYDIYNCDILSSVRKFANLAYQAGISGLVCSVNESRMIKEISPTLLTVTPGIRLENTIDDQKRSASLKEARDNLSDFIVVGRPIYRARDRVGVIRGILDKIG